jgi:hypothetical protein
MALKNGTADFFATFRVFTPEKYSKFQNNIRKMAPQSKYLFLEWQNGSEIWIFIFSDVDCRFKTILR